MNRPGLQIFENEKTHLLRSLIKSMMFPCFQINDENLRIKSKSDIFIDARNILLRQVRAMLLLYHFKLPQHATVFI